MKNVRLRKISILLKFRGDILALLCHDMLSLELMRIANVLTPSCWNYI